jgi:hypothetical protein
MFEHSGQVKKVTCSARHQPISASTLNTIKPTCFITDGKKTFRFGSVSLFYYAKSIEVRRSRTKCIGHLPIPGSAKSSACDFENGILTSKLGQVLTLIFKTAFRKSKLGQVLTHYNERSTNH